VRFAVRSAVRSADRSADRSAERSAERSHGFTLVEVLVALVIVALALGACLRAAGALTSAQDRLEEQIYAGWSADNRLIEIRLARTFPEVGRREAACPQGKRALVCVEEVSVTPNPGIRRVEVVVYSGASRDAGEAPILRRTGFVANLPGEVNPS